MLEYNATAATPTCRRLVVSPCDVYESKNNPATVDGILVALKIGEVIDIGLDWSQWIAANAGKIKASAWAAHAQSPQEPTLGVDGIDQDRLHTIVVLDLSAAASGDIYYITNTLTVEGVQSGGFTIPDRTIKRVIGIRAIA